MTYVIPEHTYAISDAETFCRTARKEHRCHACRTAILKSHRYIEYCGTTSLYQSGRRYHLRCAFLQGLIVAICRAGKDGDCNAIGCPQLLDNEPATSGRSCPLHDSTRIDEEA